MKRSVLWMIAVTTACGAQVVTRPPDAGDDVVVAPDVEATSDTHTVDVQPDAPTCLAAGAVCDTGTLCCSGYCDYNPYSPSASRCIERRNDGEYCESSLHCRSGRCVDEICRASTCGAVGARCDDDANCCVGFCTASAMSYVPGQCARAQPTGGACDGPRWCLSGRCVEGLCAP